MANKKKFKIKNFWQVIFAFFPLINSLPFFIMSSNPKITSKSKKKKWKIFAWICVVLNILLIATVFLAQEMRAPDYVDMSTSPDMPYLSDYVDTNLYEDDGYKKTDEYREYEKAYKEYEKAYKEW